MPLDILSSAIPFFFIAAVVYGALEVSGVFANKNIKMIISGVIAFFTLTYEPLILFINQILPYAAIFFIIVFFVAFLFKPLKREGKEGRDYTLIIVVAGLVLVFLANSGYELIKQWFPQLSNINFMVAIGVVIIILVLYAAYKRQGQGE